MSLDSEPSLEAAMPQFGTPYVQENRLDAAAGRVISIPWYRLLVAFWNRTGQGTGYVPGQNQPGGMTLFAGASPPAGYVLADGASYPIDAFPNLFSVIGYTYGGAGSSFNVPNSAPIGGINWIIRAS